MNLPAHIIPALENIYISPLELCNLNCKYCYTNKTKNVLSNDQILNFISSYSAFLRSEICQLRSVLFCGGEVFTLPGFCNLVNQLTDQNIFISIITNGTIDKLDQIKDPNSVQLLVSLDGPREIHDANRGPGNFDKTIEFINSALNKGFHVEIMFLVSPESYEYVDTFGKYLSLNVRAIHESPLRINHITIKSSAYSNNHPLASHNSALQNQSLTPSQIINIKKNYPSIPAKNFGCFQLSLQSNANFYGCCESPTPLGSLSDPLEAVVDNFVKSLSPCSRCKLSALMHDSSDAIFFSAHSDSEQAYSEPEGSEHSKKILRSVTECRGCTNPDFLCGYKKELQLVNCTDVVKAFK